MAERGGELHGWEGEEFGDGCGGAEGAGRGGDVPSVSVVRGAQRIPDRELCLDAHDEGEEEFLPSRLAGFGEGQESREGCCAGVDYSQ